MQDERDKRRQRVALFRFGLIGDLVHLEPGSPGLYAKIRQKAQLDYRIPGSPRTRVKPETIRHWLKLYRKGGFDGLVPKVRRDAGRSRSIPEQVADLLVSIKEGNRKLSIRQVIKAARQSGLVADDLRLPPSTVHRLLTRHGLMDRQPDEPTDQDRRRFQFQKAGDLWFSDVMHGPAVVLDGTRQKRKTYLVAFLDDATRVVPHAAFAFSENTQAFMPVFKGALLRRGIPKRLYADNGAAYRTHHLNLVCAKLGIALIHSRPYRPQGRGKQERWFRTVRMQLLPLLTPDDLGSLDALNRRLGAYIEGEYHRSPHRALDRQTPLDRWASVADEVRYVGPDMDLDDLFLFEAKRRVWKDRTVSLKGTAYEVDASLVGETVLLRYDPSKPGRPVQVWHQGRYVHDAKVVDAYANCFVRRNRPSQTIEATSAPSNHAVSSPPSDRGSAIDPAPKAGLRLSDLATAPLPERSDDTDDQDDDADNESRNDK